MYDWQKFSNPSLNNAMRFQKEIYNDVVNLLWERYKKNNDKKETISVFLTLTEDFPEIKNMFDIYYSNFENDYIWSDVVLRFLKKLVLIYENYEVQTQNV